MSTKSSAEPPKLLPSLDIPAVVIPPKRKYARRSITAGSGTALIVEQEKRLHESRKIKVAMDAIDLASQWGWEKLRDAVNERGEQLERENAEPRVCRLDRNADEPEKIK